MKLPFTFFCTEDFSTSVFALVCSSTSDSEDSDEDDSFLSEHSFMNFP